MSDTVLAIIELETNPEEVARRAAWVARTFDCRLSLLLCDPSLSILRDSFILSNQAKEVSASIETAQQEILESLTSMIAADGNIDIDADITHDRPAHEAIISIATETEPRFVVKGTQYHSAAERATFAYTDWQLIRKLDSPLWFVKPHAWREHPVIVAAVDPTHENDRDGSVDQVIVDSGLDLAARCNGKLVLLHTYQRLVEIGTYAKLRFKPVKLPVEDLDRQIRESHRQKLDALAARYDIPAENVHQLPGRTRDILPTFARTQGAAVVIMGALSRASRMQRTIGSTAEQVLDHLNCDILIVRENG